MTSHERDVIATAYARIMGIIVELGEEYVVDEDTATTMAGLERSAAELRTLLGLD